MKRYRIEVVGSTYPIKEVEADYMSCNGSYYFYRNKENEPDELIAAYPIHRSVILSITDLHLPKKIGVL